MGPESFIFLCFSLEKAPTLDSPGSCCAWLMLLLFLLLSLLLVAFNVVPLFVVVVVVCVARVVEVVVADVEALLMRPYYESPINRALLIGAC